MCSSDLLVHNFLRLLAGKGRAGSIPGIRDEFQALVDRAQGRVAVELTTAYELSDEEAEIQRAAIAQAERVVVLADGSKLGTATAAIVANAGAACVRPRGLRFLGWLGCQQPWLPGSAAPCGSGLRILGLRVVRVVRV